MVTETVKRVLAGGWPVALVIVLLPTSFYLLSAATQNSADFGRLYSPLLIINGAALLLLAALIARDLVGLARQLRRRVPGARLTARLVVMFVLLALAPVSIVYYVSLGFLQRGIDSWFDVRVDRALEDALELGRHALESRLRELLRQTRLLSVELNDVPDNVAALKLNELRQQAKSNEMILLTVQGRIIASSSADATDIVPSLPGEHLLVQVRQGLDYAALEPTQAGLQVRIAVRLAESSGLREQRILHAIYPVPERLSTLAESVQDSYARYQELSFLRQPLKHSFTLTLSLVLLLSLLSSVWAAFFSARRLVAPIRDLAEGTRAVAAGDYDMRLPLPGRDELGFLVRSFNEMTRKISLARDQARRSQRQVEAQRSYLETVLEHLSSGVLTMTEEGVLRTSNTAASQILGLKKEELVALTLTEIAMTQPRLDPFVSTLLPHLTDQSHEWHTEVTLIGAGGHQVLICRGSVLPETGERVIVFDDVTALIQAQRDAAWGEVARRLAHEIKNPLTPIQLSAERLRHKYLHRMEAEDAEVLDRSTHTIVQQVEAMKEMVKAFSEYAHTPAARMVPLDLNTLVDEVLDLYRGEQRLRLRVTLDRSLPAVNADAGRMRQLLHNLVKNALEAGTTQGEPIRLTVITRSRGADRSDVELRLEDNGPGIPEELLNRLFEPYVTSKPKGTGLGLAIVKKIVEEHGGALTAENLEAGGAAITVRLPASPGAGRHADTRNSGRST